MAHDDDIADRGNFDHSYHHLQQGKSWMGLGQSPADLHVERADSNPPLSGRASRNHSHHSQPGDSYFEDSPLTATSSIFQDFSPLGAGGLTANVNPISPRPTTSLRANSLPGLDSNNNSEFRQQPRVQSAFPSVFRISIPTSTSEQDGEGGIFASYRINIKTSFSRIEVQRRYSHFSHLHQDLVSSVGGQVYLPPLPLSLSGSMTGSESFQASENTRLGLQAYLQALGSIPKVWQCSRFIDFLDCTHPLLGLQVQFTSLTDDVSALRAENSILSSEWRSMRTSLEKATHAISTMQARLSAVEKQQQRQHEQQQQQQQHQHRQRQGSGSGYVPSPVSSPVTSPAPQPPRPRLSYPYTDSAGPPPPATRYAGVLQDSWESSRPSAGHVSGPPGSSSYRSGGVGAANLDAGGGWGAAGQQDGTSLGSRHVGHASRVAGATSRQEPHIQHLQEAAISPSLNSNIGSSSGITNTKTAAANECVLDEDSFAKFFGLGVGALTSSAETMLQQTVTATVPSKLSSGLPSGLSSVTQSVTMSTGEAVADSASQKPRQTPKPNRIASLISDNLAVVSDLLPMDVIKGAMSNPTILQFSRDLLQIILPTRAQLLYRYNIEKYISKLVRKSLGAQLYQTGLNSLNCFLPDDPVALSVYMCRGLEHSWYVRLNEKLSRMSAGGAASTDQADDEEDKTPDGDGEAESDPSTVLPKGLPAVSETKTVVPKPPPAPDAPPQPHVGGPCHHPISNVNVVTDELESVLQCVVGTTAVNIRANLKIDLCFAAFLEEMDISVGRDHLFKKSLTLIRAWWIYESPKYAGDDDTFDPGLVPDTALCIVVCAVFNLYSNLITDPMHALMLYLAEYSDFDWDVYALTIFGRVKRSLIEALPYSTFIKKNGRLFSAPIIQRYQKILHGTSTDLLDRTQAAAAMSQSDSSGNCDGPKSAIFTLFERIEDDEDKNNPTTENAEYVGHSNYKIYHPLEPNVNVLGEAVVPSPSNGNVSQRVMETAASKMRDILTRAGNPTTTMMEDLREFFAVTLDRFEGGWRPDMLIQPSPSDGSGDADDPRPLSISSVDLTLGGGSSSSDQEFLNEIGEDPLQISVDFLSEKIKHCNFLLEAQVTEPVLQQLSKDILLERGPLPVGEIGKMLQEITSISTLSAYLKEKYGGLKKFLEMFEQDFVISVDHPFNPHVFLRHTLQLEDILAIHSGSIPLHLSTKANKRRLSRRKRLTSHGSTTMSSDRGSPQERSRSFNSGYERSNSIASSRNSYTSQLSYSPCSTPPPPHGSFYISQSPPPDPGDTSHLRSNHYQHQHQPQPQHQHQHNLHSQLLSQHGAHGSSGFPDDRRRSHNDDVLHGDRGDYFDPHANRKSIPNRKFREHQYQQQPPREEFHGFGDSSFGLGSSSGSGSMFGTNNAGLPPPERAYGSPDHFYRSGARPVGGGSRMM